MLNQRQKQELDRHITGNGGEDQFPKRKFKPGKSRRALKAGVIVRYRGMDDNRRYCVEDVRKQPHNGDQLMARIKQLTNHGRSLNEAFWESFRRLQAIK